MLRDRFGNEHAPGVPYARGRILTGTEDDFRKVRQAWRHIETRIAAGGSGAVFKFIAPETLARFEGAGAYARAIDDGLTKLARMLARPDDIARLLLGD